MKGLFVFLLTQSLCLLNCVLGIILQVANTTYKTNIPGTTMLFYYVMQAALWVMPSARVSLTLKQNLWISSIGFLDALTNVCNAYSYAYSDVASIILLLSLSSPFAMIFSFFILKRKYSAECVLVAVFVVIVAITFTIIDKNNFYNAANKLIGDILAIVSALGYAFTSTLNEKYSQGITIIAYLPRLSNGGLIVCLAFALASDLKVWPDTPYQGFLLQLPYGFLMVSFYFIAVYIQQKISAVHYNVCLLCTNVYTFFCAIFILNTSYTWTQVFPAISIIIGVTVYFLQPQETAESSQSAAATTTLPENVQPPPTPARDETVA